MGFADDMQQFDDQWSEDQEKADKILDDARYTNAVITQLLVHEGDESYAIMVRWEVDGEGSIRRWYNLDSDERRSWAAQDFKKMGYTGKLSELQKWIEAGNGVGLVCDITVKTTHKEERDYKNAYLNSVLGESAAGTSARPSQGDSDDDIPF